MNEVGSEESMAFLSAERERRGAGGARNWPLSSIGFCLDSRSRPLFAPSW